jgi:hypothetical protein
MENKQFRKIIGLVILLMVTLSCSLPGGILGGSSKYLGEEYRSELGGYTLKKAKDYTLEEGWGMLSMISPEGTDTLGPAMLIIGGASGEGESAQGLMDEMTSNTSSELRVNNVKAYKVNGVSGLIADLDATMEGELAKGRIFVAVPFGNQTFVFMAYAPQDQWRGFENVADAVLKSVQFFEVADEVTYTEEETVPVEPVEPEISSGGFEGIAGSSDTSLSAYIPNSQSGELRQWASSAIGSSEYMPESFSAKQATGPNNVFACSDDGLAWAAQNSYTEEFIELYYDVPVHPTQVVIYETYNPSQVTSVILYDQEDVPHVVYDATPYITACPNVKVVNVDLDDNLTIKKVVINIDQSVLSLGWGEIDAVELVGIP